MLLLALHRPPQREAHLVDRAAEARLWALQPMELAFHSVPGECQSQSWVHLVIAAREAPVGSLMAPTSPVLVRRRRRIASLGTSRSSSPRKSRSSTRLDAKSGAIQSCTALRA